MKNQPTSEQAEEQAEQALWDEASGHNSEASATAAEQFPALAASVCTLDEALRGLSKMEEPASLKGRVDAGLDARVLAAAKGKTVGTQALGNNTSTSDPSPLPTEFTTPGESAAPGENTSFRARRSAWQSPLALAAGVLIVTGGVGFFLLSAQDQVDPATTVGTMGLDAEPRTDVGPGPEVASASTDVTVLEAADGTRVMVDDGTTSSSMGGVEFSVVPSVSGTQVKFAGPWASDGSITIEPEAAADVTPVPAGLVVTSLTGEPFRLTFDGVGDLPKEATPLSVSIAGESKRGTLGISRNGKTAWTAEQIEE